MKLGFRPSKYTTNVDTFEVYEDEAHAVQSFA